MLGPFVRRKGTGRSYRTLAAVPAEKNLLLSGLMPLGLDGGLLGVVLVDLVLGWISHLVE